MTETRCCSGCGMPFDHRQNRPRHCGNKACPWCIDCAPGTDQRLIEWQQREEKDR